MTGALVRKHERSREDWQMLRDYYHRFVVEARGLAEELGDREAAAALDSIVRRLPVSHYDPRQGELTL